MVKAAAAIGPARACQYPFGPTDMPIIELGLRETDVGVASASAPWFLVHGAPNKTAPRLVKTMRFYNITDSDWPTCIVFAVMMDSVWLNKI